MPQGQGDPILPEDLGRNCAKLLLEEVYRVSTLTLSGLKNLDKYLQYTTRKHYNLSTFTALVYTHSLVMTMSADQLRNCLLAA